MRYLFALVNLLLLAGRAMEAQPAGTITTVAGDGVRGFKGDGGPALSASMAQPFGVLAATESNGSVTLYVSDSFNNRVRRIGADGRISTFAGSAVPGFAGDGGPAVDASLNINTGMAAGPNGSFFLADFNNSRIRRIDAGGRISTYGGSAAAGFSGDGGPATAAGLKQPMNLALAADGTMYITDRDNHRIRQISPSGIITTFCGNGEAAYAGDGGPAKMASLKFPTGVAVGPDGVIYVADWGNARIRRIGTDGTITTIAGTGTIGFSGDGGPAIDAALNEPRNILVSGGLLFIADSGNNRIRRVTLADGRITTFAGNGTAGFSGDNGPATAAQLTMPQSISLGADGALYIADTDNNRIRRVAGATALSRSSILLSTTQITLNRAVNGRGTSPYSFTVASSDQPLPFTVSATTTSGGDWLRVVGSGSVTPSSVEFTIDHASLEAGSYSGTISVNSADSANGLQRIAVNLLVVPEVNYLARADTATIITVVGNGNRAFSGDGGSALSAALNQPHGLAVGLRADLKTNLFISDTFNHRIRQVDLSTGTIETIAGRNLAGFVAEAEGNLATIGSLNVPAGLNFSPEGELLIADLNNNRIRRVDRFGRITTFAGTGSPGYSGEGIAIERNLFLPSAVVSAPDGSRYVADRDNHRIRKIDAQGYISTVAGNGTPGMSGDGGPAIEAQLKYPTGIAIGSDGSLYIADWKNNRIRRVNPDGNITTLAGTGEAGFSGDGLGTEIRLNEPLALALGGDALYFSDVLNQRVRRLNLVDGLVTTIAGTGTAGFSGDSGPAVNARLTMPQAIALGIDGSLFVADTGNDRIRRIVFASPPTTVTPASLLLSSPRIAFTMTSGGSAPAPQTIAVTSSIGALDVSATVTGAPSWLRIDPLSGRTPLNLRISINNSGLSAGSYNATIQFSAPNAVASQSLAVTLVVTAPATVLSSTPGSIDFVTTAGGPEPAAQVLRVSAQPPATALAIQPSGGASWVQVDGITGGNPWDVSIRTRSAALAPGYYATTLVLSGANISAPLSVPITLRVNPAPVAASASFDAESIQFRGLTESGAPPEQSVRLSVTAGTATYSVTTTPRTWLSVSSPTLSPRPGSPGELRVSVNTAGLPAGTYEGEIVVNEGNTVRARVPVQLFLTARINPEIKLESSFVQLSAPVGASGVVGQIIVRNPSPVGLNFEVTSATADGSQWLETNPSGSDDVSADKPKMITVRANVDQLAAGTYTGTVLLTARQGGLISQSVSVPVVLAVTDRPAELVVSQSAMTFNIQRGGRQTKDVSMIAVGSGSIPWTAQVTRGAAWLNLSKLRDTALSGGVPQTIDVSVSGSSLNPGEFDGEIQILAQGAPRPIVISVKSKVAAGSPDPTPIPSSLAFVPRADGSNPETRGFYVSGASGAVSFSALAAPDNPVSGTAWLSLQSKSGTVPNFDVAVNLRDLPAGQYRANINLSFAGNVPGLVQILAVKPGAGTASPTGASGKVGTRQADGCIPTKYFPLFTSAQPRFNLALGEPLQTEIVVVDDCGRLVTDGAAGSLFSNGEPSLTLNSVGDGRWSASWVPKINEAGEVLVDTLATDSKRTVEPSSVRVRAFLAGSVEGPVLNAADPITSVDGSPARAIAPGSRIVIRGRRLASQSTAMVTLGGAPLDVISAGPEQVVAVVPPSFDGRGPQPLIVRNGERQSAPYSIIVARIWPIIMAAEDPADGNLALTVSGISEAAESGTLSMLQFEVDAERCYATSASALESGLWRVTLSDCLNGTPAATTISVGTRYARTQKFRK